ncbi:MAG TPA: hypothetical protein VJI46_02785 [Candidatus Nanoarchaeia archaeon]|nr:hypothetical protein [Candidatus Nanoarchaeia archaeon]
MGEWKDLGYKLKQYFNFTPAELRGLAVSILVVAFIISFADWGKGETPDAAAGLFNLLIAIIITAITFFVRESARRVAALSVGYRAEYKVWLWGLLIGLVVVFVSRGYVWLLLPGGILLHHLAGHRLGHFRYGLNFFGLGMVSMVAPIANLVLAVIIKIVNAYLQLDVLTKALYLNLLLAIFSVLPIPPMDGSKMFFGSRMVYSFMFAAIILASVLLFLDIPIWVSVLGSFVGAVVCWLLYYIYFERFAWEKGPYP